MQYLLSAGNFFDPLQRRWLLLPFALVCLVGILVLAVFQPKMSLMVSGVILLSVAIIPKPENGLLIIAALLPFEQITALGVGFSAIKYVSIILLIAWFRRLYLKKQTSINLRDPSAVFLMLFLAFATLSLTQIEDFAAGVGRLTTLYLVVLLYFIAIDLIDDKKILEKIMLVLVASAAVAAFIQLAHFALGTAEARAVGIYKDPNHSALTLLVIIPLSLILLKRTNGLSRLIPWGAFFLLLGGTVLLLSRGAMVALFIMFLLLARTGSLTDRHRRIMMTMVVLIIAIFPLLISVDSRFSLERIRRSEGSGRLMIWKTANQIFSDNWVFGTGLETFSDFYIDYASKNVSIKASELKRYYAHNLFIEAAVETGIFGALTLLSFFGFSLFNLWRTMKDSSLFDSDLALYSALFFVSIVGFFVGSLFLSTLTRKLLWFILALAVGNSGLIIRRPLPPQSEDGLTPAPPVVIN